MRDGRAAAALPAFVVELGHVVFLPFSRRQTHQSLATTEPDQPPQASYHSARNNFELFRVVFGIN